MRCYRRCEKRNNHREVYGNMKTNVAMILEHYIIFTRNTHADKKAHGQLLAAACRFLLELLLLMASIAEPVGLLLP